MNKQEIEFLKKFAFRPTVLSVDDLEDKSDRTLLYGYICTRHTWHVYLKDGVITTLMYFGVSSIADDINVVEIRSNSEFIPDKRLYPTKCDFEFCKLLIANGGHLPFTTYDDNDFLVQKQYYGITL